MTAWEEFKHNIRGLIISYFQDGGITVFAREFGRFQVGLFVFNPFRVFAVGFIFELNYFDGLNVNIGAVLLGFYIRSI